MARPADAQLPPERSLATLQPLEGLDVSLWAAEPMLSNPTSMDIDSRGRVWIAEGLNYRLWAGKNPELKRVSGADRIKILEDADHDGRADKVTVFADNIFPVPMGLAVEEVWRDGQYRGARVYVGNSPDLLVLEDTDGDDRADRRYALLTGFGGIDSDHGLHGMALGPDGRLYFTQGDGRYGTDQIEERQVTLDVTDRSGRRVQSAAFGTTMRVRLDGTRLEVLGTRQRNNYETCVDSFGNVFTSDNDDDGERGCRMIWVMEGGNYGYRMERSQRHWAEELPGVVPKLVGTGNGSPAGILVYEADLLPAPCRGAVLQVDAGTHQLNLFPLQRHGAAMRSDYQVLLRGTDPWFRPVDAAVAPDGSVFVCDWYDGAVGGNLFSDQTTGRIYRIAPAGHRPQAVSPDFSTLAGCVAALQSPNVASRFAARQAILAAVAAEPPARPAAQGNGKASPARQARQLLLELYRSGEPRERARALFVLAELPGTGPADVLAALRDRDARLREVALRIITDALKEHPDGWPSEAALLQAVLPLAHDGDAGVRRQLLLALRRLPSDRASEALLELAARWDGRDRYYLEALRLAWHRRPSRLVKLLFDAALRRARRDMARGGPVALPPYYPTTTNDAFLRIGTELPPATEASKLIGLAWVLQRVEALPALQAMLESDPPAQLVRGVDLALAQLDDPQAAQLLIDRFLAVSAPERQRQILRQLAAGLAGPWQSVRDAAKTTAVFQRALQTDGLQVEAIQAIARCGAEQFAPRLLALASDAQQPLSTRAAALQALGRLRYRPARQMAAELAATAKGQPQAGPLALAALAAASQLEGTAAAGQLRHAAADSAYPLDFRRRAVQLLAADRAGAMWLLEQHRQSKFSGPLATEITFLLHNHPDRAVRRAAREAIPLPKTASGRAVDDLRQILALPADVQRGKQVFYRQGSNACAQCHRVQGVGNWVGPDLSSIGTKYGKSELLFHILNPSSAINYNYVPYTLVLADGRILSGLVVDQTADRLVLKTAQGERIEIAAEQIDERLPQNVSIMPDNLIATMTEQDLADLVAWLSTLQQPVSVVGQYYLLGPLAAGTFRPAAVVDVDRSWKMPDGRQLRWQLAQTGRDQYLDLSARLGSEPGRELFCLIPVLADRPQRVRVVLSTENEVALWHNGRPVQLVDAARKTGLPAREGEVLLGPGNHQLMIRVASGNIAAGLATTLVADHAVRFSFESSSAGLSE